MLTSKSHAAVESHRLVVCNVEEDTASVLHEVIRIPNPTSLIIVNHLLDRILVMDAGLVGEYASPKELLKNPKSLFSQLIAAEQQQEREGGYGSDEKSDEETKSVDSADSEGHGFIPLDSKNGVMATEKARVSSAGSIPDSQTSIESSDSASKKETVNR